MRLSFSFSCSLTTPTMTIELQALTNAIKLFGPRILAALAGYLLASPWILRLWIATRNLKTLPIEKHKAIGPLRKTTKLMVIGSMFVFLVLQGILIFQDIPYVSGAYLFFLFAPTIFSGFTRIFNISGSIEWGVHRDDRGVWHTSVIKRSIAKKQRVILWGILLFSVPLTLGAFFTANTPIVTLASTAWIYNMSHRARKPSASLQTIVVGVFFRIGFTLLLCLASFVWKPSYESDSSYFYLFPSNAKYAWILESAYAVIPGQLISLCLRFDYQKYLDTSDSPPEVSLTSHPAPSPKRWKSRFLGEGVVIPSRAPTTFPRVYYITMLVGWALSQTGVLCVHAFTPLSFNNSSEYSIVAVILELPVMFLVLFGMAAIRGDLGALWTYRENWTLQVGGTNASETTKPLMGENIKLVADAGHAI